MRVYIVSRRGTAHSGELVKADVVLTAEACNLDDAARSAPYADEAVAMSIAKRRCSRCMPAPRQIPEA